MFFIFSSLVHQFHTMSHILNHFLLGTLFHFLVLGLWMDSIWTFSLAMIPISKIQQDLIQLLKDNLWFVSFCNKNNCKSDLKFRLLWLGKTFFHHILAKMVLNGIFFKSLSYWITTDLHLIKKIVLMTCAKNHLKINDVEFRIHALKNNFCFYKNSANPTFIFISSKVVYL